MQKQIEDVINQIKPDWSKDEIIRFLYIKLAPFFQRDLLYFTATDEEKYKEFQQGFINRGYNICCSTISDYYVNLFKEFGINAKKVAANSAKIPLFVVLVEGDNSWYYIDPLNDLFHNQYGLKTTEYGIIPHYKTLSQYHFLETLPKEYIESIDKKLGMPQTLDSAFQDLHMEMTERNSIFDFFQIEKGDYTSLFQHKIDFMNEHLINLGDVKGPYERIILYLFLERMLFFKNEKKNITIKLNKDGDTYYPFIEFYDHKSKQTTTYHEEDDGKQRILIKQ